MESKEFHHKETGRKAESKEGEAKAELDRLISRGEWMQLRNNKEFQEMSLEGKISTAMKTVNVRIGQMEKIFYSELSQRPRNSAIILEKTIKPMRRLNDALGARLAGEYDRQDEGTNDAVGFVLGIAREDQSSVAVDAATINNNQIPKLKKTA